MSAIQPITPAAVAALPPNIRFGGSSWTYPGWKGLIYHRTYKSDREFRGECLREYGESPLFRTVGVDSAFYNPPSEEVLRRYVGQLPKGFQWVEKVWERITIPKYPGHPRYGEDRGTVNPDFLNPKIFEDGVLSLHRAAEIRPFVGPFVFQFPTIRRDVMGASEFMFRLREFLGALPRDFRYAIEIRNQEFLVPSYFEVLNEFGVTHCFNHWHIMPPLKEQMKRAAAAGGLSADFYVARILTPLGVSYEGAVKLFEPYERIKRPNEEMRRDVVRLVKRAIERNVDAYIIVNNRSEGNSPGTISAIAEMVMAGATTTVD
ncbi:MAG: hypothetical protein RL417_2467 [Pseudomonadota bacterium]|jgi:uncharacterized protein YecE (DUF72 family)